VGRKVPSPVEPQEDDGETEPSVDTATRGQPQLGQDLFCAEAGTT